jgi:hypothetical protein
VIPADCIPADGEVVCEVESGPDGMGRHRFFLYWLISYQPITAPEAKPVRPGRWVRAQCFHAELAGYRRRTTADGNTWRLIDRRPETVVRLSPFPPELPAQEDE